MARAHGRIIDGAGNGVPGTCYFYRALDHEPSAWRSMTDASGRPVAGTIFGRPLVYTGIKADAVRDADRRGFFDVPGGLPSGTYWIDFHPAGDPAQQRWAWPFPVTDGTVPMDVRVGGPSVGVPGGQPRILAVFGDSDSSERGPIGARSTDLAKELTGNGLVAVNRAEGATPIHGFMTEGDDPRKRNGVEQVERACREMSRIDVAVCRFGLNDAHMGDMNPPSLAGITAIRTSYETAIDLLKRKGAEVVLVTIILEADRRNDRVPADKAINDIIRDLAEKKGCKLVDHGIDARTDPQDYVWNEDGIHLNDRGTRYVAGLIRAKIAASVPPPAIDPTLTKQFTPGTFTASVSLYGLLGAPIDRAKRDLSRFRAAGFGNARVWIDWGTIDKYRMDGCAVFDADGNFVEPVAKKLDELTLYGESIGMSFDLTMHADHYKTRKVSDEGYDITEHKRAIRNTLVRWGRRPAVRILDMANEAEVRGPSPGSGSPAHGHVSPGRFLEMMEVARSVPRTCLVSCSVSGGGDFPGDVAANYVALFRSAKGEILLPHFGRKSGWGAREGQMGADLRRAIPGLAVHHQEPARNGYNGQNWPVSEFEQAFRTSKAAGAVGCCMHTDAGFDVRSRDAWDQLDEVERQVVANLKGWIA